MPERRVLNCEWGQSLERKKQSRWKRGARSPDQTRGLPDQGGALAKGDDRGVRSKKTHVLLCPGQDIPQKRGTLTQEAEVMSLVTLAISKVLPEGSLHGEALSVTWPCTLPVPPWPIYANLRALFHACSPPYESTGAVTMQQRLAGAARPHSLIRKSPH